MSKKISSRKKMPKRILLFLISTSFILFVLSLGYFLFVNSDKTNNTPYYKASGAQNTGFTMITQKEAWSKSILQEGKVLLAKDAIEENFIAQTDNLGIIAIPFNTHNRSINDRIVFRIKQTGKNDWYFQSIYNADQFQADVPFPFGFPVIKNSKNNVYTFEIESLKGTSSNSISISKSNNHFFTKYKFSKAELVKSPKELSEFFVAKMNAQLPFLTGSNIILILFSALSPLVLYVIFTKAYPIFMPDKRIRSLLSKNEIFNLKRPLNRDDKIKLCSLIISVGFFSSVAFHYFQGMYYGQGFPLNTFIPNWFFGDFLLVFDQWSKFKFMGVGFGLSYFPGTYLFMDLMTKLFSDHVAVLALITSFTIFIFAYTYNNVKTDNKIGSIQNAFIISLMSYPFLFAFQTANLEIVTFISVCLFFIFYKKHRTFSLLALAYAISMKVFPGIFIILLLLEKRYKDILLTSIFTLFFTLLPLLIFDGGFNKGIGNYIIHLKGSQQMYANLMIMTEAGNHYGNSILNGLRTLFPNLIPSMTTILLPYEIFAFVVFLIVVGYLIFFEKTFWRKVACLVMMMNLLPFTSTDYKLLYIFLPLFFLINHLKRAKYDAIFIILFSLLLISKDYFYFNNNPLSTLNVVANPIIMSTILLLIIFLGIKSNLRQAKFIFNNNKLLRKITRSI
jgi:hypothetical protein